MEKLEQIQMIQKDTERLKSFWAVRDAQMLKERDIINLVETRKKTTKDIKWKSNDPKVFFDTARSLISIYPPRFRLPMAINPEADEKQKMNKAERLAIGIYRQLNSRQAELGKGIWLWELAYWILLGWYAVFGIVEKIPDGIRFKADIWDPLTVYPEWDENGLVRCLRTYSVDKATALSMVSNFQSRGLKFSFIEPTDNLEVGIVNYWHREDAQKPKIWNAITVADQLIKPMTLQRNLHRIPIQIGAIGSPDMVSENWKTRKGESIIAANRDMYVYSDIMVSLMATIMAETAYPNLITKTKTGQPPFKAEELKGYGSQVSLKLEDHIELLKHAATPTEANLLLQWCESAKQKGSVPATVYGYLPIELSGFAISQLLAAIRYKLGPYLAAEEFVLGNLIADFLYQYKTGNFPKLTLSTENPSDLKRGLTYIEEFSQEDIPERIYVESTIPISSQFDKTQQILNARQALQPPQLLSRETLWETELDIQDTEMERERIRQDQVDQDPFVLGIEILEGLRSKEATYRASGLPQAAEAIHNYILLKEMEMGMRKGIPTKAGGEPGIPSSQMPPEARESPDQMRAMRGVGPPGLARRPQTPEERAESKRGIMIKPGGEVLL